MNEEIRKIIEQVKNDSEGKAKLDDLHLCQMCVWYKEENGKRLCQCKNIVLNARYAPYCKWYLTNDQAIEVLALQEKKKDCDEVIRKHMLIDTVLYLITAASSLLVDIDAEMEKQYGELDEKTEKQIQKYKDGKKKRDRLLKSFKKMRISMSDIQSEYNNYVEHFIKMFYANEDDTFNVQEFDKHSKNAGLIRAYVTKLVDVTLDRKENLQAIFDYMNTFEGTGYLKPRDFEKGLVRL